MELAQYGTMIKVRNIHKNSGNKGIYRRKIKSHYDYCIDIMNDYSLILLNTTLKLTSEFLSKKS